MEKLINLNDLFIEQSRDLYNAAKQLINAYPIIIDKVLLRELRLALKNHQEQKKEQIYRLEEVFNMLEVSPRGEECEAMKGLIRQALELIENTEPQVLDAAILGALQQVVHYEIAGYGSACTYAKTLGYIEIGGVFYEILKEEKAMSEYLTAIAKEKITLNSQSNPIKDKP